MNRSRLNSSLGIKPHPLDDSHTKRVNTTDPIKLPKSKRNPLVSRGIIIIISKASRFKFFRCVKALMCRLVLLINWQ